MRNCQVSTLPLSLAENLQAKHAGRKHHSQPASARGPQTHERQVSGGRQRVKLTVPGDAVEEADGGQKPQELIATFALPNTEKDPTLKVGSRVEVWYQDGWYKGSIVQLPEDSAEKDMYSVQCDVDKEHILTYSEIVRPLNEAAPNTVLVASANEPAVIVTTSTYLTPRGSVTSDHCSQRSPSVAGEVEPPPSAVFRLGHGHGGSYSASSCPSDMPMSARDWPNTGPNSAREWPVSDLQAQGVVLEQAPPSFPSVSGYVWSNPSSSVTLPDAVPLPCVSDVTSQASAEDHLASNSSATAAILRGASLVSLDPNGSGPTNSHETSASKLASALDDPQALHDAYLRLLRASPSAGSKSGNRPTSNDETVGSSPTKSPASSPAKSRGPTRNALEVPASKSMQKRPVSASRVNSNRNTSPSKQLARGRGGMRSISNGAETPRGRRGGSQSTMATRRSNN